MARIIALAQRKGGVGKTTLAVSLAAEIRRCGGEVALVDTDPQRSACDWAELGNLGFPVHGLSVEDASISDWAESIMQFEVDNLIIDTAPNDQALAASIALCHIVLLPCTPSGLDIEATNRALQIVDAVRKRRRDPPLVAIVPNRVDVRTLEGRQLVEELRQSGETIGPEVGNRSAFVRAFSKGVAVCDAAPGSNADREIRALWQMVERMLNDTSQKAWSAKIGPEVAPAAENVEAKRDPFT
jgi:chromosome partitioning protein